MTEKRRAVRRSPQTSSRGTRPGLAVLGVMLLAGCEGDQAGNWRQTDPGTQPAPSGYLLQPDVTAVVAASAGGLRLSGMAPAGSRLQLVPITGGAGWSVLADSRGRWQVQIPAPSGPVQVAVSATAEGRELAAQGGLVILPGVRAVRISPGRASRRISPGQQLLETVDFDRQGAAVLSGQAGPGQTISVRIDRQAAGSATARADGTYELATTVPLGDGIRVLEVASDTHETHFEISAAPASAAAVRAVTNGWRVDWRTPSGALQSTLILN